MIKLFEVRDAQWSSKSSFSLPAWHGTNDWKTGFRKLWLQEVLGGEKYCDEFIVESWESFEDTLKDVKLMDINRFLIYVPINTKGREQALWSEVLDAFNLEVPSWNTKFDPVALTKGYLPHLALCLDKKNTEIENQTTFLVPHWESLGFIELFLYSCRKVFEAKSPHILVIDDGSSKATLEELIDLCNLYGADVKQIQRLDREKVADVGAVLDYGLKSVKTKYVCMLDADIVLTNPKMITDCVRILDDKSIISIGLDTSLAEEYHSNFHWGKNRVTKSVGRQLPGYLSVTNNLFRFMRTEDAKTVSNRCGFARANHERKMKDQLGRAIRKFSRKILNKEMNLVINDLINSRFLNSRYPVMPPTCDNGVAANAWMDQNMIGVKWNYPITSYGIITERDGIAFQNISGLMVHIALSTRALSDTRREVESAGDDYYNAVKSIVERKDSLDSRLKLVVELSQRNGITNVQ